MDLSLDHVAVVEAEQVAQNLDDWNGIQNRFNLKTVAKTISYPKSLVTAALRDFNSWAETYHLDASKFRFVRITFQDPTWQVDFHDDMDPTGAHVCMYDIYFNATRRVIMQRCISIT